jgi:hypothetical protein
LPTDAVYVCPGATEKLTGEKPVAKSWPELFRSVVHMPERSAPSAYCVATVRVTGVCAIACGQSRDKSNAAVPTVTGQLNKDLWLFRPTLFKAVPAKLVGVYYLCQRLT